MSKFLLVFGKKGIAEYRTSRIIEEIEKAGHEFDTLCSFGMKIMAGSIFINGENTDLRKYDAVYSIGNGELQHYLVALAAQKSKAKIWPSSEILPMDDKFFEAIFLDSLDVPIPKTILLTGRDFEIIDQLVDEIGGYPCIIKKVTGSGGKYVGLINSADEVELFLKKMPHPSIFGKKNVILQEYIKESKGTDFRVFCVGDEILGAIQRTASDDNFKANISLGGSAKQIEVTAEMEKYAKIIMKEGKMMFAGIDFIKSKKGYLVLETNTSANFKGFEEVTGINVAKKILDEFLKK